MTIYVGLDVSDRTTHVCVVDADGGVLRRDVVASDPDALARWMRRHCEGISRVVLETGPLSAFLYHGLVERGVPVVCICARHAKGVLSDQSQLVSALRGSIFDCWGLTQQILPLGQCGRAATFVGLAVDEMTLLV